MALSSLSRIPFVLTLMVMMSGCAEAVFLAELFTDIDERIADDIREQEGDQGIFGAFSEPTPHFREDDALRFPDAAEECAAYAEAERESHSLTEREYLRAMKKANCRAQ